jgi:dipeptide/tripeptide permease
MVYFLLYSQMHTTFYIQGLFMKTPSYFPYAGAEAINNITIMLMIPFVIFKVYPYWKRRYGLLSPFLKSQVGFALISMSMVVAGMLEYFRILHSDPTYNEVAKVRLHFYSLLDITVSQSLEFYMRFPQYFLIAISEVFVVIVALKVAYIQAPRQFKSVSMGILYMFNALGTLLAAAILLLTQLITYYAFDGHGWICQDLNIGQMYYYFFVVCGLMLVNMIVLCFKSDSYEISISI